MKLAKSHIIIILAAVILSMTVIFFVSVRKIDLSAFLNLKPGIKTGPDSAIISEKQMPFPPDIVKAVYVTSWSASKSDFIDHLIDLAKDAKLNGLVIDIKDWSGYVAYDTALSQVEQYGAQSIRIQNIGSLIERLHEQGIYLIARITVFQDPLLAKARPDLALHSKSKMSSSTDSFLSQDSLWLDRAGLAWIDPTSKESWDYNVTVAREAFELGFDEINFDYIRFPSDGDTSDIVFPLWDGNVQKHLVIRDFFRYLREKLPGVKSSVDLFGLSTVNHDDLGVGQVIEDAFESFDYVYPMVYPSHYAVGFLGYQNPAEHPYEVVSYSMEHAFKRVAAFNEVYGTNVQLRPWLQDFNLGAVYDLGMVKSEIKAVYDAAKENFRGFLLWDSYNIYTEEALKD